MSHRHQSQQDRIERKLDRLLYMENVMSAEMDALKASVAAQATVTASVATLLGDLNARLKQAIADDDPEAIKAIAADVDANTKALSDAVLANTSPAPVVDAPADPVVDPSAPAADPTT